MKNLKNLKNIIDFYLRKFLPFSRGLIQPYSRLGEDNPENLYILDILNRFAPKGIYKNVLDIGCKNWAYAPAMREYFSDAVKIDGIELDVNRLYTDFYSRKDYAKYHIKNLQNTNYIEGDLMDLEGTNCMYDFITWFLPFVLKKPHQNWGLPDKFFRPEKMLEYAFSLLNQEGILFIVNQGRCEADEQIALFEKLNIPYQNLGQITSSVRVYENERFLFVVKK